MTRRIDIDDIKAEAESLAADEKVSNAFTTRSANEWLEESKSRPQPLKLYDELWCEGELCFMFADSNAGKSILAVQMADDISRGRGNGKPQKVLYFDFELSMKQFEKRYSQEYQNHYVFDENFYRLEINAKAELPERFKNDTEWINYSFEQAIVESGASVIICDNITYMRDELEKAHIASDMMKMLNRLIDKYGLSILALAHTPKRDMTKVLTKNDLGGSKMLTNFCDSSFAIGESMKDKGLRYIKQIKVRDSEFRYHEENVAVYQIAKEGNFLEFQFLGYSTEREHLKTLTDKERDELPQLVRTYSYLPQREIAKRAGCSVGTVNRILKSFETGDS